LRTVVRKRRKAERVNVDIYVWWNNHPYQTNIFIHGGPKMKPLEAGHVAVMIITETDMSDAKILKTFLTELLPPHGLFHNKSKPADVLKYQGFTFLSDSPSACAAVMAPFTDFCTDLDSAGVANGGTL
jgi:hypothetical protein